MGGRLLSLLKDTFHQKGLESFDEIKIQIVTMDAKASASTTANPLTAYVSSGRGTVNPFVLCLKIAFSWHPPWQGVKKLVNYMLMFLQKEPKGRRDASWYTERKQCQKHSDETFTSQHSDTVVSARWSGVDVPITSETIQGNLWRAWSEQWLRTAARWLWRRLNDRDDGLARCDLWCRLIKCWLFYTCLYT